MKRQMVCANSDIFKNVKMICPLDLTLGRKALRKMSKRFEESMRSIWISQPLTL